MKSIKIVLSVLLFILVMFPLARNVWSAYLVLTRIGTLSTAGLTYTTWTVTGAVPDFAGTATPSAMVAVTVNAVTATTSAAINGTWTSKPSNIVPGNNSVSIASGNEVISFILSYTPAATPTQALEIATVSGLPATGTFTWPLIVVSVGILVFVLGRQIGNRIEDEWNI